MKAKKFVAALLATGMTMSLVACGTDTASNTTETVETTTEAATESANTEKVTDEAENTGAEYENCTITMDWWGGDSRHNATLAAIEAFEKAYPGITVDVNYGSWDSWEVAKAAEYISGNNPDVQQIGIDWIGKYDADGTTYLDLNTVSDALDLTQWSDSILEFAKDSNGALAAVPISMTGRTLFWNTATWSAAGLDTPTTLAELEAAGPIFKEKLGDNYYPLVLTEYDRMIFMTFWLQAQYGTPLINQDGNLTYTVDQLEEGLAFIQRLEDEHVIPTEEYILGEAADSMDKSARNINGEYAGNFEWDTSIGKYIVSAYGGEENLVVGNLFEDMGPYGTGSYAKVSQLFIISANSEHPHEAALFLNFILNEEEGVKLMGTERGIPVSKAGLEILESAGIIDEFSRQAHDSALGSDPMYWNPLFDDSSLQGSTGAYIDIFDGLSFGDYDLSTAAQNLYDALTAVAPAVE